MKSGKKIQKGIEVWKIGFPLRVTWAFLQKIQDVAVNAEKILSPCSFN